MGLFKSREEREQEAAEIEARIQNSECSQLFASAFCNFLNEGDEHFQWLMANSKERMYEIAVFKDGVQLKRIEVNQRRLKETGSYDVDSEGWGFGASGFEDLPNGKFVSAFQSYLFNAIKRNCPHIKFVEYNKIMLADNVKKGW